MNTTIKRGFTWVGLSAGLLSLAFVAYVVWIWLFGGPPLNRVTKHGFELTIVRIDRVRDDNDERFRIDFVMRRQASVPPYFIFRDVLTPVTISTYDQKGNLVNQSACNVIFSKEFRATALCASGVTVITEPVTNAASRSIRVSQVIESDKIAIP